MELPEVASAVLGGRARAGQAGGLAARGRGCGDEAGSRGAVSDFKMRLPTTALVRVRGQNDLLRALPPQTAGELGDEGV